MFTEKEIAYIRSQRLVRIATVDGDGQPDVAPVGFEFDDADFHVSGHNMTTTRKYKNVVANNRKIALVIDDFAPGDGWNARGIRIYGTAELVEREGWLGFGIYIRVTPEVSWSWGVEGQSKRKAIHKVTA